MKGNGKMINAMDMGPIIMLMDQVIAVSGRKICSMDMESKNQITGTYMKGKIFFNSREHKYGKKNGFGKFLWSDGSYYEG